ncbi:MAG TPA: TfoX/Sxy family protein [Petrotogaceae bacterium]|nr:TfoX/Sxy family protein [Petrotogaceae bacterium]
MKLSETQNIGAVFETLLIRVGIHDSTELLDAGSKEAFKKIKNIEGQACINMLFALEGAVQGKRWHKLSQQEKEDLRFFFRSL